MSRDRPVIHGRDHAPGGADPIGELFGMVPLKDYYVSTPISFLAMVNLPQTYAHLLLLSETKSDQTNAAADGITFNGDTSAVYSYVYGRSVAGTFGGGSNTAQTMGRIGETAGTSGNGIAQASLLYIPSYTRPTGPRSAVALWGSQSNTLMVGMHTLAYNASGAITSLTRHATAGNYDVPTRFSLYAISKKADFNGPY